jgi:uncharacterized protein (UPF0332 family)
MLDNKKLEEIQKAVALLRNEGEITKDESNKRFAAFYTENALISLNTAKMLSRLSSDASLKKQFDFLDDSFESYLWVINASYYSMFYMANALLAQLGVKIKSELGVHKKAYWALIYYFYLTKRIAKHYMELFEDAQEESNELMGMEKAKELLEKYGSEMDKRARFTYNIGEKAKESKAKTSLQRAMEFHNECLRILDTL